MYAYEYLYGTNLWHRGRCLVEAELMTTSLIFWRNLDLGGPGGGGRRGGGIDAERTGKNTT